MIKVAIVEDIKEIREGLQLLINSNNAFSCKHTYSNAEKALLNIPLTLPDVVLMDIHLPGMSGIEAVRSLKPRFLSMQFIMSTVYEDDENIFESLKAGATGYLLKKTSPDKILEAITDVYKGGSPISAEIARKVIASFQKENPVDAIPELTPREKEILKALSKGLRYKEIANEMHISMDTVRTHVRHIYEKLQVQSRIEAVNKVYGHK
ncbi:MAG TPA: response regulator transcription factor [Bacteroidia bacterium]|jgi:RNA polymerase sigma factor (sigma-70 family)|nr:response regulator transcription factor [Bacteroidia bacterium]